MNEEQPAREPAAASAGSDDQARFDRRGVPDVFADGFYVTFSDYGCTLTLYRTHPTEEDPNADREVVARVRVTPKLLHELAEIVGRSIAVSPLPPVQESGVRH